MLNDFLDYKILNLSIAVFLFIFYLFQNCGFNLKCYSNSADLKKRNLFTKSLNDSNLREISTQNFTLTHNYSHFKRLSSKFYQTLLTDTNDSNDTRVSNKILVVYAYFDEPWRAENLKFFINKVLLPEYATAQYEIDYIFVVNGFSLSVDIPQYSNVHIIKRENSGFDLCAWKVGIDYSRLHLNKT